MKRIIAALLALCLLLSFCGCVAEDREYVPHGGGLAEDHDDEVISEDEVIQELTLTYYPNRSMNPYQCSDFTNRALFSLMYQGLFAVDRDYQVVPILCSSYQVSEDMKTYTIYIEEDAAFSNGSKLTVYDVLESYEAAWASDYYKGRFTHVKDIAVSGDAIVFELKVPMEDLTILLDIPIVKDGQTDATLPLGTGPYVLSGGISSGYLTRVEDWWCADRADLILTAASIELQTAESPAQIRDEFQFGDLDLVCANPCSDLYADYRCDYELWDCENGEFLYLACNVEDSWIFSYDTLRSVLTYGIDRDALSEKYYQGFARAVTLPASTYSPGYSTGLAAKYEYDPEKFTEALESITLPRNKLELLVNSDDTLRLQVARQIAASLTELGLPMETVEADSKEFAELVRKGKYDLYLGCTRLSPNMDLSAFFAPGGSLSYNGIASEDLYGLCLDALENHGNFYTLYQKVAQDGRIVPLVFCSYAVYATRGRLSDLRPSRDNVFFYTTGRTAEDARMAVDYSAED
ncbi:MAG: hypothetical protein IKY17_05900 [Oscillospiraceae bacterium]|nr:hypothetical protein [Oscillospiraceae bacterium]